MSKVEILAISVGVLLTFAAVSHAQYEAPDLPQYDRSIETAAISKLQEKINDDLRGTIDLLEPGFEWAIVPQPQSDRHRGALTYTPPKPDTEKPALKPIVQNNSIMVPGIDETMTGSIVKPHKHHKPLTVWERFDSRGNIIHPKW